ncbi:MAG: IclR family transcriptional regulator [Oscillibacter sp.]|nr:IclR family transcriptional regulator [Oscillibacter sp.]
MQLVDRTLAALEAMSRSPEGLSVSELAAILQLPPSSTHRLLDSLRNDHFAVQDAQTKKYRLSYKIISLAARVEKNNALIACSKPIMERLAKQIDRNIVLCVLERGHVINVACVEKEDASLYMVKIGIELPLYSTSAGRVFAAYMDRTQALRYFSEEDRNPRTPYTKTSLEELTRELDRIHSLGFSEIDEELQMGICGVACPIFDLNGEAAASLAFTTVKTGDEAALKDKIRQLKSAAEEITRAIK